MEKEINKTQDRVIFIKLKTFAIITNTTEWSKLIDFNDKYDFANQIKEIIDFLCKYSGHWIEMEINSNNGYNYWKNDTRKVIIILDNWIEEKRDK